MQHWHRGCVDAGLKIAYFSKTLGLKASAQSLYEKRSSILAALKKWRHYLLGSKVIIRTDQQTLKFITSQRLTEGVQHFFFDSASSINWLSSTIWLNTTKEKKIKWQMPFPEEIRIIYCRAALSHHHIHTWLDTRYYQQLRHWCKMPKMDN